MNLWKFDGSYKSYFRWILNQFDAQQKTKYDIFSQKHKTFSLSFNNFQNSIGKPLIRIRNSLVTDNYLATEEIQNQNWQYFIERVKEVCKSKEIDSTIQPDEEFLLSTVENVILTKKLCNMVYNMIARNFYSTILKLSVDEKKKKLRKILLVNIFGGRIV